MSATEIIEQIKALPSEEQAKVAAFVRNMEINSTPPKPRTMDEATFRRLADKVFEQNDELFRKLAE